MYKKTIDLKEELFMATKFSRKTFLKAGAAGLGRFLLFEQEIQAVGILLRCSGTGGAHIKCHHAKTSSTRDAEELEKLKKMLNKF